MEVDSFTRETFYSSLEMGKDVLSIMGLDDDLIERQVQILKEHDLDILCQQLAIKDDQSALISKAAEGRDRFRQVLAAERENKQQNERA